MQTLLCIRPPFVLSLVPYASLHHVRAVAAGGVDGHLVEHLRERDARRAVVLLGELGVVDGRRLVGNVPYMKSALRGKGEICPSLPVNSSLMLRQMQASKRGRGVQKSTRKVADVICGTSLVRIAVAVDVGAQLGILLQVL